MQGKTQEQTRDKYLIYEQEKRKIQAQLLTNEEYDRLIRELAERLGI